jgi:sec-independent protein translocase protein TatA
MLHSLAFLGTQEWIIIMVIVLILFGGKKIPELLRGVGKGVGELQKGLDEGKRTMHETIESERNKATVAEAGEPEKSAR